MLLYPVPNKTKGSAGVVIALRTFFGALSKWVIHTEAVPAPVKDIVVTVTLPLLKSENGKSNGAPFITAVLPKKFDIFHLCLSDDDAQNIYKNQPDDSNNACLCPP